MIELPQLVPSSRCLTCDVCCRFLEAESPLRPYFTSEEMTAAGAHGMEASAFPDRRGGKIRLIPHPAGEGFICPAFDVETSRCRIYPVRPLDCRLYPFAVMRPPHGDEVLLGWDRKCPYLREETDRMLPLSVSSEIARQLRQGNEPSVLTRHPGLIGAFQEDVWVIQPLPAVQAPHSIRVTPPDPRLTLLTVDDYPKLQAACRTNGPDELSTSIAVTFLIWQSLMRFWWAEVEGGISLVAEQAGTFFMPIPPFGSDLVNAATSAVDLLDQLNRNPAVSRIERVSESQMRKLKTARFSCRWQGEEYLYERKALAELAGGRYKSQRWNDNQARRRYHPSYEPYSSSDLQACLYLYARWRAGKEPKSPDRYSAALMEDSFYAHWKALTHIEEWQLMARVARVDGKIAAYTVGAPISRELFLVLLEIADPDYSGLGCYLFREFCRELEGHQWINTMDDSGLSSLRRSKQSYHPMRLIPFFTVTRPG